MGNRAVITTRKKDLGIYLHWNGDRGSVEGFLHYCKLKKYRNPMNDNYGWARLCQVICNFFGGCLSVGIDVYDKLDIKNGDNGVYVIDEDWKICDRLYAPPIEQRNYDFEDIIWDINERQPISEQLTEKEIKEYAHKLKNIKEFTKLVLSKLKEQTLEKQGKA